MSNKNIRILAFLLLTFAFQVAPALGQHLVLFETFTNSCDPSGSAADAQRNAFDANVNSAVASKASKIIHLDHHIIKECDRLQTPYSAAAAAHILPPGNQIWWGAVDRTVFSSTGTRGSSTESDWTEAIDAEAAKAPAATLQLVTATLDKTNSQHYVLHANVQVQLNQSFSDSLVLRYAIVQDQVQDNLDGSPTPDILNDVVRRITNEDTGTFVPFPGGGPSGSQKLETYNVTLSGPSDFNQAVRYDYTKIRLVAFLEEMHNGEFQVVNAAILKEDLDTLQAPPPTLTITNSGLDSATFAPGSNQQIFYSSTNISHGVTAFYSLDNGATWRFIADSQYSPINWTVPDSLTTQGKIKLVAVGDPSLVSIESGTFTIAAAPSVAFVRPVPGEVLGADTTYTVRWTKHAVGGVKLVYYFADQHGGFPTPITIADNITDTFYHWQIPDTDRVVELQLIPDNTEVPATFVIDTIKKLIQNSGVNSRSAGGFAITDVFPNPAASGEEMVLHYTNDTPKPISVQVLDLLGRATAQSYHMDDQAIYIDTHGLAAGVYIVRVSNGTDVISKRMEILR